MLKDLNTYDLPLWVQRYWEKVENESFFKLKEESKQYKKLYEECDQMTECYAYIAKIMDGDAVRHPMELSKVETKLLSDYIQKMRDREELEQMQMYLLGCRDMFIMLRLLEIIR